MKRFLSALLVLLCIISIPMTAFAANTRITLGKKDTSSNNAVLYATIENPSKATITDVGITLMYNGEVLKNYTETCAASYKNKASVPIWYNLKDEVKCPLDGNTEYQYTIFAVVGGKRYEASSNFKTSGKSSSVTLQTDKNKRSQTNAVLYATINNPNQIEASKAGIIIRQGNTVVKDYSENVIKDYRRSKSIPVWYDLNKELGVTLSPSTQYSYEIFAVIGGIRRSAVGSFTTGDSTAVSSPASFGKGTEVPYICCKDFSDLDNYEMGCYLACVTMGLKTLGNNVTPYDIWVLNGNSIRINSWAAIETNYNVKISETRLTGTTREKKDTLISVLNQLPEGERFLLVYIKAYWEPYVHNNSDHMVVMYLNSKGELCIHDPGYPSGGATTIEKTSMMASYKSVDERWEKVLSYRTMTAN